MGILMGHSKQLHSHNEILKGPEPQKYRDLLFLFFCLSLYLCVSIESSANERTFCPVSPPLQHPPAWPNFRRLVYAAPRRWRSYIFVLGRSATLRSSSLGYNFEFFLRSYFLWHRGEGCLSTVLHRERRHGGAACLPGVPTCRPCAGRPPNARWQMAIIFVCSSWIHQTLAF